MEEVIKSLTKLIFDFTDKHSINISESNINLILNFVFATSFFTILYNFLKKTYDFFSKIIAKADLHPIIDKVEIENATKFYISTKGQNVSPANEQEPKYSHAFTAKSNLIKFFIKAIKDESNTTRHYLILADSGMGKTTFSINFYLKYKRLIAFEKYKINLLPLANPEVDDLIKEIPLQENTLLILDGFDEDIKASTNYQKRIEELSKLTWKFRKVFITSRTQFFPSENLEPDETYLYKYSLDGHTQHYFKKIYLSPFDEDDIKSYINKKFPIWMFWNYKKRSNVKKIIKLCPNLMVRPMLLSYIDDLVDFKGQQEIAKAEKTKIFLTSSDIYKILIDRWIQREANRVESSRRVEFIENMSRFSKEIAVYIYEKKQNTLTIESNEIVEFSTKNKINLTELELKGKSLLNRDASGKYKFSHKSILEYFLAVNACENKAFGEGTLFFSNVKNFDQAAKFCGEMNM